MKVISRILASLLVLLGAIAILILYILIVQIGDFYIPPKFTVKNVYRSIAWKPYQISRYDIEFVMPRNWELHAAVEQECNDYMAVSPDGKTVLHFRPPCFMAESLPGPCPENLLIISPGKHSRFYGRYLNDDGYHEYITISTVAWEAQQSIGPRTQIPEPWCYFGGVPAGDSLFEIRARYYGDEYDERKSLDTADQIVISFISDEE